MSSLRPRSCSSFQMSWSCASAGTVFILFGSLAVGAGTWTPAAVAAGWDRVQALTAQMDEGRRRRLARLGFPPDEAAELSALHTRNFM